jgi:hypothetical protein
MPANNWIEITRRPDIGANLKAPIGDKNGVPHWSYANIGNVQPGDVIYHYDGNRKAIVGASKAVGRPWRDSIVWSGRGTRSRGIAPHLQAGLYLGLEGFRALEIPLTTAMLASRSKELFALRDALAVQGQEAVAFPFIQYRPDEVRAFQAYLTTLSRCSLSFRHGWLFRPNSTWVVPTVKQMRRPLSVSAIRSKSIPLL